MQLALSVLLLLAIIPYITTLRCYQCNSIENPNCGESGNLDNFASTCNVPGAKAEELYCRKIVQTVNKEKSIVRSCGARKGTKDCYKTAGANTASVCSCQTDLCNTAPSFNRQQQLMAIFSSIIVVAISMVIVR